jgi:S1 RNA binding domain protein
MDQSLHEARGRPGKGTRKESAACPKGAPVEFSWERKNSDVLSFEDKLSRFKKDSDEKMLDLKRCIDAKRGAGRRNASAGK